MKNLAFILFIFSAVSSRAQYIHTVAGSGVWGNTGDGGPAISAGLKGPNGIATDPAGNVYFADAQNNCVRKISVAGVITMVAGNGTAGFSGDGGAATNAELSYPQGIIRDGAGNLYIVDETNNRVRKVSVSGTITTVAGGGTGGDGGPATLAKLLQPTGVAVNGTGDLFIVEFAAYRVRKVSLSGMITTVAGTFSGYGGDGGLATAAQMNTPASVAVDGLGNLYIGDLVDNRIRKVDTAGIISTFAGNGTSGYTGDGVAATATELHTPSYIAVDSIGNVFFSDYGNNRVRMVNTAGIISTIAGTGVIGFSGDGGAATAAQLSPTGVFVGNTGIVYIADLGNNRVRAINNVMGYPEQTASTPNVSTGMTIYPNPNNGRFTISIGAATDEAATIVITNVTGSKVKEISAKANEQVDVVLNAPAGVYFVFARTASGQWCQKIVNAETK